MKFNPEDTVRAKAGGPVMRVVYDLDDGYFCTWETESAGVIGTFFFEDQLEHAATELPQEQQVLTDADAQADLDGTPRPAPWTQQRELNLEDDTPLPTICNITDGTCEACQ